MATNFSNKIGYNSVYVRDICKIFTSITGFSRMGHRMLPTEFSLSDSRCHGNEIWDKNGYTRLM